MIYEVNGRKVNHDPSQIVRCTLCGQDKPRFSGNVQHFKDVTVPEMCLECQRERRKTRKKEALLQPANSARNESRSGKRHQTCLTLSDRGRKVLPMLAHLTGKTQSDLVDAWIVRALSELPSDKTQHLLALVDGLPDDWAAV